ncbi:MAG TPA: hypothetical protein VK192_11860, partial [Sphingomicrobium sp.]|nr:hypothetical protein [Sphingomicrobium sp.]
MHCASPHEPARHAFRRRVNDVDRFRAVEQAFRPTDDLGYELPASDTRMIDYTYAITLSPDETKLYYVLSIIQKLG